jgi:hypothetical protein
MIRKYSRLQGPLNTEEALRLALQIASALSLEVVFA